MERGLEKRVSFIDRIKNKVKNNLRLFAYSAIGLVGISGCGAGGLIGMSNEPPSRIGCSPYPTILTRYLGEDAVKYQRGILYTCRAGNIDMAHLRKFADWTVCFKKDTYTRLMNNETEFSFNLREPSKYFVKLNYPENWNSIDENKKQAIAEEISIKLGQYFSYNASIWHEIITWFKWKSTGVVSEFTSAFSWEDGFSDALGVFIGALALQEKQPYEKAIDSVIDRELKNLGIQSSSVAKKAVQSVKGKWYSGILLTQETKKRSFDIGSNGYVKPVIIPNVSECQGAEPWLCPVPNTNFLSENGFSMELEIEPRVSMGSRILKISGKEKTINPKEDFPKIVDYIKKQAKEEYGYEID